MGVLYERDFPFPLLLCDTKTLYICNCFFIKQINASKKTGQSKQINVQGYIIFFLKKKHM